MDLKKKQICQQDGVSSDMAKYYQRLLWKEYNLYYILKNYLFNQNLLHLILFSFPNSLIIKNFFFLWHPLLLLSARKSLKAKIVALHWVFFLRWKVQNVWRDSNHKWNKVRITIKKKKLVWNNTSHRYISPQEFR